MEIQGGKFHELILYVARQCESDPRCGSTKLNKILFYADFEAYRKLGASISGEEYQKLEHGPAPRRLLPAIEEMERAGWCAWATRDHYGFTLRKLLALREPDTARFSGPELDIVNRVIRDLWELNATEVSDLSHRFAGWQAADLGETIPYETVFVGQPRPLSPEEAAWVDELLREEDERESASQGRPAAGVRS
jgi:hypothetical protein